MTGFNNPLNQKCSLPAVLLAATVSFISAPVWADHKTPSMQAEDKVTTYELAPLTQALTLAQIERDGQHHTLAVIQADSQWVTGINLSAWFNQYPKDSLTLVREQGLTNLIALLQSQGTGKQLPGTGKPGVSENQQQTIAGLQQISALQDAGMMLEKIPAHALLPAGGAENTQLAAGTNYEEHGEETDVDEVFLFPKYSATGGYITQVQARSDQMMDYEVELCARWDREITTLADYQASQPGLFLCGDFTDRAEMLRKINLDNIASGHGFTDAKSGHDRFPTGRWLVVPVDWRNILPEIRLQTWVNRELKQNSRADKMIKDLDTLVTDILEKGQEKDWRYQNQPVALMTGASIPQGQSLLTGTPEGVIFNTPGVGYYITTLSKWLLTFQFVESGPMDYLIDELIEDSTAQKRYLQPGDHVTLKGRYLGDIQAKMTDLSGTGPVRKEQAMAE